MLPPPGRLIAGALWAPCFLFGQSLEPIDWPNLPVTPVKRTLSVRIAPEHVPGADRLDLKSVQLSLLWKNLTTGFEKALEAAPGAGRWQVDTYPWEPGKYELSLIAKGRGARLYDRLKEHLLRTDFRNALALWARNRRGLPPAGDNEPAKSLAQGLGFFEPSFGQVDAGLVAEAQRLASHPDFPVSSKDDGRLLNQLEPIASSVSQTVRGEPRLFSLAASGGNTALRATDGRNKDKEQEADRQKPNDQKPNDPKPGGPKPSEPECSRGSWLSLILLAVMLVALLTAIIGAVQHRLKEVPERILFVVSLASVSIQFMRGHELAAGTYHWLCGVAFLFTLGTLIGAWWQKKDARLLRAIPLLGLFIVLGSLEYFRVGAMGDLREESKCVMQSYGLWSKPAQPEPQPMVTRPSP